MAGVFNSHQATAKAVSDYAKKVEGPLAAQNRAAQDLQAAIQNAYAGTHWSQELGALVSQLEAFRQRGTQLVAEIKRVNDRAKNQASGI